MARRPRRSPDSTPRRRLSTPPYCLTFSLRLSTPFSLYLSLLLSTLSSLLSTLLISSDRLTYRLISTSLAVATFYASLLSSLFLYSSTFLDSRTISTIYCLISTAISTSSTASHLSTPTVFYARSFYLSYYSTLYFIFGLLLISQLLVLRVRRTTLSRPRSDSLLPLGRRFSTLALLRSRRAYCASSTVAALLHSQFVAQPSLRDSPYCKPRALYLLLSLHSCDALRLYTLRYSDVLATALRGLDVRFHYSQRPRRLHYGFPLL